MLTLALVTSFSVAIPSMTKLEAEIELCQIQVDRTLASIYKVVALQGDKLLGQVHLVNGKLVLASGEPL